VSQVIIKRALWALALLALLYFVAPTTTPWWLWAAGSVLALAICFLPPKT